MIGRGRRRALASLLVAGWLLVATSLGTVAVAADPSAGPAASPSAGPTITTAPDCAERYPDPGPAGLDLRLGCVVSELVGAYTGSSDPSVAPRISDWLRPLGIVLIGVAVVAAGALYARRRAGRRLVAAAPTAWWSCPGCRSLNAAGAETCYRCGRAWEADALELRTDAEPPAPQAFGRRGDR